MGYALILKRRRGGEIHETLKQAKHINLASVIMCMSPRKCNSNKLC